jgi:hypothetical protein
MFIGCLPDYEHCGADSTPLFSADPSALVLLAVVVEYPENECEEYSYEYRHVDRVDHLLGDKFEKYGYEKCHRSTEQQIYYE